MKRRRGTYLLSLALVSHLSLLGCSTDPAAGQDAGGPDAQLDSRVTVDTAPKTDADMSSDLEQVPDTLNSPDQEVTQAMTCQPSLSCNNKSECEAKGLLDCDDGQCIQCLVDEDCPGTMDCDPIGHFCQICKVDDDCSANGQPIGTGKCDPAIWNCTRCDDSSDCADAGSGFSTVCAEIPSLLGDTMKMCVGCASDDDCVNTRFSVCDVATGVCSKCKSDDECCVFPGLCPVKCNVASGACECTSTEQCVDAYAGEAMWECK